jgi:asparagine synthase (glutamine-hydrolysing)
VIEVAFSIPPQAKINRGNDKVGKRIHRATSIALGVPEDVALRGKEAAQHGANVHDAFEEIALRQGVTPDDLRATRYDPDRSITEKLGSSSRYGYRYGDAKLWEPPAHVQFYLDGVAADAGLLVGDARNNWATANEQLSGTASGRS